MFIQKIQCVQAREHPPRPIAIAYVLCVYLIRGWERLTGSDESANPKHRDNSAAFETWDVVCRPGVLPTSCRLDWHGQQQDRVDLVHHHITYNQYNHFQRISGLAASFRLSCYKWLPRPSETSLAAGPLLS